VTRAIILLVLTLHTNGKCFDGIQQQGLNFYFGISWVSLNYFFLYCRERFINQANQIYWFCIFIPKSQTNSKTKPLARFFLGPRFFKLHSWRRHRCHGCDLPGLPAHHLCSWRTWSPFALALVLSLSLSLSRTQKHTGFHCDELVAVCCGSRSIKKALEEDSRSGVDLSKLLSDCIVTFKDNGQYRNDGRFLKIWFLYVISYSSVNFCFRNSIAWTVFTVLACLHRLLNFIFVLLGLKCLMGLLGLSS
jgi:hypothetical protein